MCSISEREETSPSRAAEFLSSTCSNTARPTTFSALLRVLHDISPLRGKNQMRAIPPLVRCPRERRSTHGALAAVPAPAALLPSHRASLLSAGLPGTFPQDRAGQRWEWLQQKEPQIHALCPRPSGPAPLPRSTLTFQAEHRAARRAAARRGPASLPSLPPPAPPARPAGKPGRGSAATHRTGSSSWAGSARIICQHLALPSCSSWAPSGQR